MEQQQVKPVIHNHKEEPWKVLRFQIFVYCHFNKVTCVTEADLDMIALLYLDPDRNLDSFCREVAERGIFASPQSARNAVRKAIKNNLITRTFGKKEQVLHVNPNVRYSTEANILLTYNLLAIGMPEPPQFVQEPKLKDIKNIVKID